MALTPWWSPTPMAAQVWLTLQGSVRLPALVQPCTTARCDPQRTEGGQWLAVSHFRASSYGPASALRVGTPCGPAWAVLGEACSCHAPGTTCGSSSNEITCKSIWKICWYQPVHPFERDSTAEWGFREYTSTRLSITKQSTLWEKLIWNRLAQVSCSYCCLCKALDICVILCPSSLHKWHSISWTTLLAATVPHFGWGHFLQRTGGITAKETGMTLNSYEWGRYFDMTFIFIASD